MDGTGKSTTELPVASASDHPVWDVYDELRTARLTAKYYAAIRKRLERRTILVELVIASTASGSAVAGLAFWSKTGIGQTVWQVLAVISAAMAIIKPMLRWSDKLQRLDELIVQYRGIEHELRKIEIGVRQSNSYDAALQAKLAAVLERKNELVLKESADVIDEKLRRKCREQVDRELPAAHFFVPPR